MKRVGRSLPGVFVAAMGCFLVFGAGAGAAPAAPQAQAQKPQAPAPAAPDDPAKVAAAKTFIQLYHPNIDPKNVAKTIDNLMPRAIAAAKKNDPKLDEKKYREEKTAQIMGNAARSLDNQSHIVSRHFTLDELKQLIAFYSSPIGRKLTTETRNITMELRQLQRETRMKVKLSNDPKSGKVVLVPADDKKK